MLFSSTTPLELIEGDRQFKNSVDELLTGTSQANAPFAVARAIVLPAAACARGFWNRLRGKKNERMGGSVKKSGRFAKKKRRLPLRETALPNTRIEHGGSTIRRG